ncbi:MAG: S8 family serine peptidase [Candidatus Schekmanbacteria bacterium]|nr:S8 family serine peptidase [Candidatus Schekmanbacteria bacterium]
MRRIWTVAMALVVGAALVTSAAAEFDTSKVLVKVKNGVDLFDLSDQLAARGFYMESVTALGGGRLDVDEFALTARESAPAFVSVRVPQGADVRQAVRTIGGIQGVEHVALNQIFRAFATPNDYNATEQWNFAKIGMPAAWDVSFGGSSSTIVSVVDTGLYRGYNDGPANILPGYDAVDNDNDPSDGNGHGTHVSGTVAQATGNGTGVTGIVFNASMLPVKVLSDKGEGTLEQVANGIRWAADNGAHVINMSLGCEATEEGCDDPILHESVQYAAGKGVFIAAASGNASASVVGFPAAYEECMAVGATGSSDTRASFSNYGTALDIAAPGDGIKQQTHLFTCFGFAVVGTPNIESCSGTSMASPHVAGLAGLIHSAASSTVNIRDVIESTATDLGTSGWDQYYGWGRINAAAALQAVSGN